MNAYTLAVIACGAFFLNALLTGVWKYRQMAASENGQAHIYVDLSHRTSLMYAFACMLLAMFVNISRLEPWVELLATGLLVAYFAIAVGTYMVHGFRRDTDNQLRDAPAFVHAFMWTLITAEIGGFLVLFYGVLDALL